MKILLSIIASLALTLNSAAQKYIYCKVFVDVIKDKRRTYAKVNLDYTVYYGDSSRLNSIESNLNNSNALKKLRKKGKYQAALKFKITKDGTISDVACIKEDKLGICEELVKLTKKSPKWTVGEVKLVKELKTVTQ
jgi:hypothetical protein